MYCTHYIPSVLICICTINKDYYMKTGRFPLCFYQYVYCEVLVKILKSCDAKSAAYAPIMQDPDKYAWVKYTRDLLCSQGFGNVNL